MVEGGKIDKGHHAAQVWFHHVNQLKNLFNQSRCMAYMVVTPLLKYLSISRDQYCLF